jgi:AcrR family transcriptional regulator
MPRISTPTLVQHREWRRQQLVAAACEIALERGGEAVTVAAVAARAGLSRTSGYEYFGSSEELIADLVLDELAHFSQALSGAISDTEDSYLAIEQWIEAALRYIADGRHLLAKALSAISTPADRAREIGVAHQGLLAPLQAALVEIGITDVMHSLVLIQSITDAATKRIEAGNNAELEIESATNFCIAGIRALVR